MLKTLSQSLVGLVFPPICENCAHLLAPHQTGVCKACRTRIQLIQAPHCPTCGRTYLLSPQSCEACRGESFAFDRAFACTAYDGIIKKMLLSFKFEGSKGLRFFFADLMAEFMDKQAAPLNLDAIVSVPMNPRKERDRGFNQSMLLASTLAKKLKKPFLSSVLSCHQNLIPQSSLNKSDRKQHVRGVFEIRKNRPIEGKRLLLVDDILTTGQTASECARALKAAGCASVTVLAVARGL